MTEPFLLIQYPYESIEIALCSESTIVEKKSIHKFEAIKLLIPTIDTILKDNNLTLKNLTCVAINRGPGPYNTLRSIIATVNGFFFTQKINIVELEALPLLLKDKQEPTVALLNAFSKRVYYGIKQNNTIVQGVCSVQDLPKVLEQNNFNKNAATFIGNGIEVYKDELAEILNLTVEKNNPTFNTLESAAQEANKLIKAKKFIDKYSSPMYFI